MMFRPSMFALMATAMTFAAEGVNITVNVAVDSRIDSVELKAGSQTLGPVAKNGSASWTAWGVGTAYTPTFTGVAPGYEGRWTVTMSGQATLSGGEESTITIPSYSYTGCTLSFTGQAKTYTVTLDRQSGNGGTASVTATYGSAMPAATMPTRKGYTFGGYYTGTDGDGTQYYTASGASAKNWSEASATKLYAKWTADTYTLTLDSQSGSGGSSSVTATYDAAMPTIAVPTRTGYTFGGYYTGTDGGGTQYYTAAGASAKNWDKTSATTLYAKWTALTYNVTLDLQGGSGGSTNVTATYGSRRRCPVLSGGWDQREALGQDERHDPLREVDGRQVHGQAGPPAGERRPRCRDCDQQRSDAYAGFKPHAPGLHVRRVLHGGERRRDAVLQGRRNQRAEME